MENVNAWETRAELDKETVEVLSKLGTGTAEESESAEKLAHQLGYQTIYALAKKLDLFKGQTVLLRTIIEIKDDPQSYTSVEKRMVERLEALGV